MGYKEDRLFLTDDDNDTLEKIGADLGEDTSLWLQKIKNIFSKEYPELLSSGSRPHFKFTHKDFSNGMAVGGVTITVGARILLFPLVIKDRNVAPFDVFYDQEDRSWHYMTQEVLNGLLNNTTPYKGLAKNNLKGYDMIDSKTRNDNLASWRDPAKLSSLNLNSMDKVASYLEKNKDKFYAAHQSFVSNLKKYSGAYYNQRIGREGIAKMASLKYKANEHGDYDVAMITKIDVDDYHIKLGTFGKRVLAEENLSRTDVKKLASEFGKLSNKLLEEADRGGSPVIARDDSTPTRIVSTNLEDVIRNKPNMVSTFGTYETTTSDGNTAIGVAHPIKGWDGDDTGKLLFANHEVYAVTGAFPGRRTSENMRLPEGNLSAGVKGFFIKDSEGQAYCSNPFRIDAIYSDEQADMHITATDLSTMSKMHLVKSDAYKNLARIDPTMAPELIDHDATNHYVPHNMRFSPLPEIQVKILTSGDSSIKLGEARAMTDHNGPIVTLTKKAQYYTLHQKDSRLKGEGFSDYETGDVAKMAFLINICGADVDIEEMEKLGTGEEADIFIPSHATKKRNIKDIEKKAMADFSLKQAWNIDFKNNVKQHVPSQDNIMKIAMNLPKINLGAVNDLFKIDNLSKYAEDESLNQVFDLNFLTEDNVGYFIDHLDSFEAIEDVLTRLLVVARIGNIGIDPSIVEDTLEGIVAIKEKFNHAKVIMKKS